MSDGRLDWEWTRTAFRKALLDCANATNGIDRAEGLALAWELQGCALLMLNFHDRLSLKQQRDLANLAAACEFDGCELRGDPEWDERFTRKFIDDVMKHVRGSVSLIDGD